MGHADRAKAVIRLKLAAVAVCAACFAIEEIHAVAG